MSFLVSPGVASINKRRIRMSEFKEFDRYDALGLSELVRTKQVTASELCEKPFLV